jgi:hypothetical protein
VHALLGRSTSSVAIGSALAEGFLELVARLGGLALAVPHRGIGAAAGEQVGMGATLDDLAVDEDEDLVGIDDGGEAVGDDQRGAIPEISVSADWISRSVWVSSALVASSSRRMGGFFRMVRAMATRCFSPPESFSPRSPTIAW